MHRSLKSALFLGTILGLIFMQSALWAQGSEKKKSGIKPGCSTKCSQKLLKGVVNLDNNDIRFRTAKGLVVFVDPLAGPSDPLTKSSGMAKPDLILITHPHGDHYKPELLKEYIRKNPELVLAGPEDVCQAAKKEGIERMESVTPGNEYEMAGVHFATVPAYFTNGRSHAKENRWVGYVLKLGDATYYVTGDSGPIPEIADLRADVIFPLLWGCGGNVEQAIEMAELCKASLAVPVHHGGHVETINKFLAQLPKGTKGLYFTEGNQVTAH